MCLCLCAFVWKNLKVKNLKVRWVNMDTLVKIRIYKKEVLVEVHSRENIYGNTHGKATGIPTGLPHGNTRGNTHGNTHGITHGVTHGITHGNTHVHHPR